LLADCVIKVGKRLSAIAVTTLKRGYMDERSD
jgi:hypothetical protein